MKGVVAIGSLAATNLFGPDTAGVFSALIPLSLVATANAMVTIGPRVYYAMAQNRAFFKIAAQVRPRRRTPVVAILCQSACSILMTLTPEGPLAAPTAGHYPSRGARMPPDELASFWKSGWAQNKAEPGFTTP
jgi:amino acid transporter